MFSQVETALSEAYAAQKRYAEQSWEKSKVTPLGSQYLFVQPSVTLNEAKEQAITRLQQQAWQQNFPVITSPNGDNSQEQALVVPINLHNKTIGALQLHHSNKDQSWTKDDLAVIEAIADQLAQTADSLRLFDETRQRASREQTIREITDKLQVAPNLDFLLETASRELAQRLGVGHIVMELGIEAEASQPSASNLTKNGH